MGDEYRRFWIASREAEWRERLLAEAFEAGAEGAEEVDEPARAGSAAQFRACLYARTDAVEAVRGVLLDLLRGTSSPAAEVGAAEDLPSVDWSEAWKHGLGPIVISERLVVRPPFAPFEPLPGQREIVIDPGQAFGTGTHASTQLCLDWLDQLLSDAAGRARFARVLDVGTGSGILALAAVALGATSALGFDLDPVAIEAADDAARANGLAGSVRFECLPIERIEAGPGFGLVVANLLKRELLPIAGEIASRLAPGGSLILAGLLEEDAAEVAACFAPHGLRELERRQRLDPVGCWIAPRYGDPGASRTRQSR